MELPIRIHPAARRATDKTVVAPKSKALKYASAAPMLKTKDKVLKARSLAKQARKVKALAVQRALADRVAGNVSCSLSIYGR